MFLPFFLTLKAQKVPVTLREYLALIEGMNAQISAFDIEGFYYLARTALVKDERYIDRFDRAFSESFKGVEAVGGQAGEATDPQAIPEEWLRKMVEKHLSAEEKAQIDSLGGFEKLMETLKERLKEQEKRHQGGNKWIGTGGTSPFGAYGYNPEGVRIGQEESRHRRAVKVWDQRNFKNLDDEVELGTRNIKIALKRLRNWVREGAEDEFDLSGTIKATAEQGYLDVKTRPERRNAVKLLMFFDVGGSMDDHIKGVEELFSAAKAEFRHMDYFYFHNCPYEGLWKDNQRRYDQVTPTMEMLNTYGSDYKIVFVGDASMSPYEIAMAGGSVEHWNKEAGAVWLTRIFDRFPSAVWLNPVREEYWGYTHSIQMVREISQDRMFPLTLGGLTNAMKALG